MSELRKLKTVLFSDIVGYTTFMQEDEKFALGLLNRFKEILENSVPAYEGSITQYFGDGCLLTFDSGTNGVACAIILQKAFQDDEIPVRIGMHLGEVVFANENAFGDGVNIASRVESMGVPGAVLLTKVVYDQVKNKKEFELVSVGKHEFKHVSEIMEVFAVVQDGLVVPKRKEMKGKLKEKTTNQKLAKNALIYLGIAWVVMELFNFSILKFNLDPLLLDVLIICLFFGLIISMSITYFKGRWNRRAIMVNSMAVVSAIISTGYFVINPLSITPSSLRIIPLTKSKSPLQNLSSIAVLPVQNNLPNKENEYLLAGLHDGIITELGKFGTLKTISRTSTLGYQGTNKSLKQIGLELDVNTILESSLSPDNEQYIYRVRLLDAKTEELLWTDEFKSNIEDLPRLYNELSQVIATKLNPGPVEDIRISKDIHPEAYQEILKGNFLLQKFSKKELEESIVHYKRAIELDSAGIDGYLGVAGSWIYMQQIGIVDPKIARPNIYHYGNKAVDIDPGHWKTLGHLSYRAFLCEYNFEEGIRFSEESLKLNPNNSATRSGLAHLYMLVGEWEKAWEQIRYAKSIDPLNPQVLAFEAIMFFNDNKLLSAIKNIEKLSLIDQSSLYVKMVNVGKNRDFGLEKKAIEYLKELYADATSDPVALNRFIDKEYEKTNDVNLTWLAVLYYFQQTDFQKYYPSRVAVVLTNFLQGYDDDLFFACLKQMAEDRDPNIPYYAMRKDSELQKDPRYTEIMQEVGLW